MKKLFLITVFLIFLTAGCLEKKDRNIPYVELIIDGEMGDNGWYTGDVTISINAYDNESKIEEIKYRINGEMWRDYINMPFKLQKDGFYFIEYYAKDENGNENYRNITIKIDATKPSINFSNFEEGYIYFRGKKLITPRIPRDTMIIGDFVINVNADDALSGLKKVEFYMGNTKAYEDTEKPFEWEIESGFGVYNITCVAYDFAGNYNEISIKDVQIINL